MENSDKLANCFICDNTGYKISRNPETDTLLEEFCDCEWGQVTKDYMACFNDGGANDSNKRSTVRRIS